jgi:hypothetical protein
MFLFQEIWECACGNELRTLSCCSLKELESTVKTLRYICYEHRKTPLSRILRSSELNSAHTTPQRSVYFDVVDSAESQCAGSAVGHEPETRTFRTIFSWSSSDSTATCEYQFITTISKVSVKFRLKLYISTNNLENVPGTCMEFWYIFWKSGESRPSNNLCKRC